MPSTELLPERLPAVLACSYLVFTEGYAPTEGDALVRDELCDEGVRLARLLAQLMPDEPEVQALASLVLVQDSRRATRRRSDGGLVLLADQDRSRWNAASIEEGLERLDDAVRRGPGGRYALEAAIAATHARAPTWEATDWGAIAALYGQLADLTASPVVNLNRAVAVGYAEGPEAGLAVLDAIAGDLRLANSHLLPATRADLLRRLGRHADAADAYRTALDRVRTTPERRFLEARFDDLTP